MTCSWHSRVYEAFPAGDIDPIRDTLRALVKRRHRLRGQ
jgi:hypothetical protein